MTNEEQTQTNTHQNEPIKQLIDLALTAGRQRFQPQTGFIHYSMNVSEEEIHYPIPVFENILFCLALFRTKMSESILEGKSILEKLLSFEVEGNFPVFLHEYPKCHHLYQTVQLIPPLYWIYKHFHLVLGSELKKKIEKILVDLVSHSCETRNHFPPSYTVDLKIGAAAKAIGLLFSLPSIEEKGIGILNQLQALGQTKEWFVPASMGEMCIALQMIYPLISESPWSHFWTHLSQTWHPAISCYAGPAIKDLQYGLEPKSSLYDLYLGYFSGSFSKRAFQVHPYQIQAALIQQTLDRLPKVEGPLTLTGNVGDCSWKFICHSSFAFSTINQTPLTEPGAEKYYSPFKFIWGNQKRAHTFVCQGGNVSEYEIDVVNGGYDILFTLGEMVPVEIREKSREISFYFDAAENTRILVAGQPSTTFKMDEAVTWKTTPLSFSISFHLVDGTGQFVGHMMKGNRPSQVKDKGNQSFNVYDWQIFLRTLRRSELCRIKASIRFE